MEIYNESYVSLVDFHRFHHEKMMGFMGFDQERLGFHEEKWCFGVETDGKHGDYRRKIGFRHETRFNHESHHGLGFSFDVIFDFLALLGDFLDFA